jgi:hypothetical protein
MLHVRSRAVVALAVLAAPVAGFVACSGIDFGGPTVCAGVGYYALDVTVVDQYGQARALGARITLTDGGYTETDSTQDTLHVFAAEERGGRTYDIRVSKPYYTDAVIRGVKTRGGGCVTGHENPPVQLTVPVTLMLAPGAPILRAIRILPAGSPLLDRPPYSSSLVPIAKFDADPGVSRAVAWSIAGDTSSFRFDSASGRVTYLCAPKSNSATVTVRAVADPTVFDTMVVRFQGHPATTTDPPC